MENVKLALILSLFVAVICYAIGAPAQMGQGMAGQGMMGGKGFSYDARWGNGLSRH
jgi:hypothetical protein